MGVEALNRSAIEAEILNRDSLQSSNPPSAGTLDWPPTTAPPPAEAGIAKVMVDLYQHFDVPLTDNVLFR